MKVEFCRSRRVFRPRWITPSEICRIPHILRKPNSIIVLLLIQNIFKLLKEKMIFLFFCWPKVTQPRPQVFSVNGSIICSGLHLILTSSALNDDVLSNLVNSSWLWWIMRVVLTNQKRGNILNEYKKLYYTLNHPIRDLLSICCSQYIYQ